MLYMFSPWFYPIFADLVVIASIFRFRLIFFIEYLFPNTIFTHASKRARGVWRDGQNAFFDVRVTNTNSASQCHTTTDKILEKHEKGKKEAV